MATKIISEKSPQTLEELNAISPPPRNNDPQEPRDALRAIIEGTLQRREIGYRVHVIYEALERLGWPVRETECLLGICRTFQAQDPSLGLERLIAHLDITHDVNRRRDRL